MSWTKWPSSTNDVAAGIGVSRLWVCCYGCYARLSLSIKLLWVNSVCLKYQLPERVYTI